MISFDAFFRQTADLPIAGYHDGLRLALQQRFYENPHGELQDWLGSMKRLAGVHAVKIDCLNDAVSIGAPGQLDTARHAQLLDHLHRLQPWRKGPWDLFGIAIDAEWRSNLKWNRIRAAITPLKKRLVLDVGCGNGYYAMRMLAQGPEYVLGIEPSQKHVMQFQTVKHYVPDVPVEVLPLADADIPDNMGCFDTVFSMGVIYHRRDPLQHLATLRGSLRPQGELVLETLVVEGDAETVLEPRDRYANMRNVHTIPSVKCLHAWLEKAGFVNIRVCDSTVTSVAEQRRTAWMQFQSLDDFLDPSDPTLTIEGFPAPVRATLICNRSD